MTEPEDPMPEAPTPPVQAEREIGHPVTWGFIARVVTGALLALAVLNGLASLYLARFTPNRTYWLIDAKWSLLESAEGPVDWLIVGDSSCNQGVDNSSWDRMLGGRSLNLCTIGNMLALDDVWMLRGLIDRGITPSRVLVVHGYDVWRRDVNPELLGRIPSRQSWSDATPAVALGPIGQVRELVSRYVPLLGQTAALQHVLRHPSELFDQPFALDAQGFMREPEATPENVIRDRDGHLRALERRTFSVSPENRSALSALAEIAEARRIEIYLSPAPVYAGLFESPEFQAYVLPMHDSLRKWSEQSPRLHYVDHFQTFESSQMQNVDHVTHEGAQIFTRELADVVRTLGARAPEAFGVTDDHDGAIQ
jgi:hypothetical protein